MNLLALLGLALVLYSGFVVYIGYKRPPKLWDMAKIKLFRKVLGDNGTAIMFYIIAVACVGVGLWLLLR